MKPAVGYIGLGGMGHACAGNLLKAGYTLHVYARRAEQMHTLVQSGATPYDSPAALAHHCDIIFTNVSDTPDVLQVILGDQGIIHGARPGSVVVDMSTILPSAARNIASELASRQVEFLDAPVSGGSQGAIEGTLSVMVGGKAEVFQKVLPVLQVMGKNIAHIGDSGAGQVAKACNQIIVTQTLGAIAEAFTLATAAGVNPSRVREVLLGGFAGSKMLEVHGQRMLAHNFTPGFKTRLHDKDMHIVQQFASELGIGLPGTDLVAGYIHAAVAAGLGEQDSSAISTLFEKKLGKQFG